MIIWRTEIFAFIFFFTLCMCNIKNDLTDPRVDFDQLYSDDSTDLVYNDDDLMDEGIDEEKSELNIFFCTANVHEFFELNKLGVQNEDRLTALIEHISEGTNLKNADVVMLCLQEDVTNSCDKISKKFMKDNSFKKFSRFEAKTGELDFTNTIVVLGKLNYICKNVVERIDSGIGVTPRSVNILDTELSDGRGNKKTFSIANTHLFGGRYDDPKISDNTKGERDKMMKKILDHKPNFILGDFNADVTGNENRASNNYWKKIFADQKFTDLNKQKKFLKSPHELLTTQNYKSVCDYSSNRVESTTPFCIVSDWIYMQQSAGDFIVNSSAVVKACQKNGAKRAVSDHDFVFCDLKMTF